MRASGLVELDAVLAVARHRGFRTAAIELDMSRSALSHAVAALEAKLGVRLFHRTTRSVSLTQAGEQFVAGVAPALSQIRDAMEQAGSHRDTPAGTLRLNTSTGAARQMMEPIILEYLRRYPDVTVDIVTENRLIDIVVDGFDAGFRLAELVPQDMIAVPVGPKLRFAVVGSPVYFESHQQPHTPADLLQHRCIRMRLPSGAIYHWEFERHGEEIEIDVNGPLILDEPHLMLDAARAGVGLAYLSEWNAGPDLANGALVRVLEDWTPPFPGLCLYYSGRRHVPAGLRALIDLIRERY
ncbi:LysR family transcriptional regulator [Bradyrhizobium sp. dw_411]|uniref:LysR family transcriptional regulator n=1 Tax=Bradyrhizobium sp. dw_411 TaxID=2720082 RepID=UPI001BCF23C4|nr:LysR family transcriptional regulator [Bradyrhizobium sp. dw_411]